MAYDPFSESTRKTKRNLLAASFMGILYATDTIELSSEGGGTYTYVYGFFVHAGRFDWVLLVVVLYLMVSVSFHVVDDWRNREGGNVIETYSKIIDEKIESENRILNNELYMYFNEFSEVSGSHEWLNNYLERVGEFYKHIAGSYKINSAQIEEELESIAKNTLTDHIDPSYFNGITKHIGELMWAHELSYENSHVFSLNNQIKSYEKFRNTRYLYEATVPLLAGVIASIFLLVNIF